MKGAMSEMELSTLRFRSVEALRRKARRGELFMTVAVGYVRVDRDRIGMDPDQRVRETVALVFRKFAEFGSIRQVHLWLCQEGVELPAVVFDQSQRRVVWKLPGYTTVHRILTNPVYAGAYAFGRTGSRTYLENGRKRVVRGFRRERDEWEVLIRNQQVSGSSPLAGSNAINDLQGSRFEPSRHVSPRCHQRPEGGSVDTGPPAARPRPASWLPSRHARARPGANVSGRYPGNLHQVGHPAEPDPRMDEQGYWQRYVWPFTANGPELPVRRRRLARRRDDTSGRPRRDPAARRDRSRTSGRDCTARGRCPVRPRGGTTADGEPAPVHGCMIRRRTVERAVA